MHIGTQLLPGGLEPPILSRDTNARENRKLSLQVHVCVGDKDARATALRLCEWVVSFEGEWGTSKSGISLSRGSRGER